MSEQKTQPVDVETAIKELADTVAGLVGVVSAIDDRVNQLSQASTSGKSSTARPMNHKTRDACNNRKYRQQLERETAALWRGHSEGRPLSIEQVPALNELLQAATTIIKDPRKGWKGSEIKPFNYRGNLYRLEITSFGRLRIQCAYGGEKRVFMQSGFGYLFDPQEFHTGAFAPANVKGKAA